MSSVSQTNVRNDDLDIWNFYNNNTPIPEGRGDCQGLTLKDFLNLDPLSNEGRQFLEDRDQYTQWLFPTNERSKGQPDSPYYRVSIQTTPEMRERMLSALDLMKKFYQLPPSNRSNFRISRIINSLCLHDLKPQAQDFCLWIINEHPAIPSNIKIIWHKIAELPMSKNLPMTNGRYNTVDSKDTDYFSRSKLHDKPRAPIKRSCCERVIQVVISFFLRKLETVTNRLRGLRRNLPAEHVYSYTPHQSLGLRLQGGNIVLNKGKFRGNVFNAMTYLRDFCDNNNVTVESLGSDYFNLSINGVIHGLDPGGIDITMMLEYCGRKNPNDFP